jgi:hypothetical protein
MESTTFQQVPGFKSLSGQLTSQSIKRVKGFGRYLIIILETKNWQ